MWISNQWFIISVFEKMLLRLWERVVSLNKIKMKSFLIFLFFTTATVVWCSKWKNDKFLFSSEQMLYFLKQKKKSINGL